MFNRITPEGESLRQMVDVTQKLVVKKWRDTSDYQAFCYIASIVPTPEYYARHKNVAQEFRYGGSKGEFSGFVVYQTLEGIPVAVVNYRDGKPNRHDYFPRVTHENVDSVSQVMRETLGGTTFQGGTPRAFIQNNETLVADVITVTGTRPENPWVINILLRPAGLPDGTTPPPIDYHSPINTGGGSGGGSIDINGRPNCFVLKCSSNESDAKTASTKLFQILQNCSKNSEVSTSVSFSDFESAVRSRPDIEHSTTLQGYMTGGGISLLPIQHAANANASVNISFNNSSTAMVHSHPTSHQTQPSGSDIMALAESLNYSPQMQASYVFVGNDVFCLQVTNPDKAKAFFANNLLEGNDFKRDSPAGGLWTYAQDRMSSMTGFSANERSSAGLAYVLELSDAGIVLSRKGINSTKFEAYGVRPNQKGDYYPTICK